MNPSNGAQEKSKIYRYVRHEEVERFMAEGWESAKDSKGRPSLQNTHHGEYGALMIWTHDVPPP